MTDQIRAELVVEALAKGFPEVAGEYERLVGSEEKLRKKTKQVSAEEEKAAERTQVWSEGGRCNPHHRQYAGLDLCRAIDASTGRDGFALGKTRGNVGGRRADRAARYNQCIHGQAHHKPRTPG